MRRTDLDDERSSKKRIGITDFKLLSTNGVLGNYEECELTHIFLIEKCTGNHSHYFALISYEEFTEVDDSLKAIFLTNSPISINDRFKLGVRKKRVSIADSQAMFDQLCNEALNIETTDFILPKDIQLLPKTHIPSLWGCNSVMVNKVLKPNFWGDKYILEFMALNNPMNGILNDKELEKINSEIKKVMPIDLAAVYDRIGSFIFQFPVTLVSGHAAISKDWCNAKLSLKLQPGFKYKDCLITTVTTKLDDVVTGSHVYDGEFEFKELELGDSNNLEFKVFNKENGLIYISSMGNFFRDFGLQLGIGGQNREPRVFIDNEGNRKEIALVEYMGTNTSEAVHYDTRTKKRIIQNDIIKNSGRFKNIYPGQRDKALEFIRMQLNDKYYSEIWLWDPYLRYADIIDTLYHVKALNIKMKCISSFRDKKKREEEAGKTPAEIKEEERGKFFQSSNNNLGINLEYRAAHGTHGFDFHDRFLFLIPRNIEEMPTVFSLGTSVNSIGKSHHLIQQTLDPRDIIEAFKELWALLCDEDTLIIKLPEDKNDR